MTGDAVSVIQAIVKDHLAAFKTAELGVVVENYPHASASDQNNYECDVRLRDSALVLKRVPVCIDRIGAAAIPSKDDLVLVQFLHGDVQSALITGRLYNDVNRPPEADTQEFVYVSPDPEKAGVRRVYLEFPKGHKLTLDDSELVFEMGKTKLSIKHDGDVELSSNAKLTIDTKGDITVNMQGSMDLSASGDIKLEGSNVSIKGKAGATLEGGGSTTVKGGTVKIAGQTNFSPA